jgi:hypothetical protein
MNVMWHTIRKGQKPTAGRDERPASKGFSLFFVSMT